MIIHHGWERPIINKMKVIKVRNALMLLLFLISTSVNADLVKGRVNMAKGTLFWDVNSQVRLMYVGLCSTYWETTPLEVNPIMKAIDYSSVLTGPYYHWELTLGSKGIRVLNRLREDWMFKESYPWDKDGVYINGVMLRLFNDEDQFSSVNKPNHDDKCARYYGENENYQPIFAATQLKEPVVVQVRSGGAVESYTIDISDLEMVDEVRRLLVEIEAEERNGEVKNQLERDYKLVVTKFVIAILALILTVAVPVIVFLKYNRVKP